MQWLRPSGEVSEGGAMSAVVCQNCGNSKREHLKAARGSMRFCPVGGLWWKPAVGERVMSADAATNLRLPRVGQAESVNRLTPTYCGQLDDPLK